MADQYSRTRLVLGEEGVDRLRNARVILFGLGGVGGYTAEALARAGIGHIDLVDNDTISLTNLNRQMLATHSTIGKFKVDVAAERIRDIDPTIAVRSFRTFYLPETADQFDFSQYDYVIDAIDTVKQCLNVFPPMLKTLKALPENMLRAAQKGFINATDLADYLVKKGLPFREAHEVVGKMVAYALANELGLIQSYAAAGSTYYYQDGVFYAMDANGQYSVIVPPAGALVEALPEDYDLITLADGNEYYLVDDTVYKVTIVEGKPYFEVLGQLYR